MTPRALAISILSRVRATDAYLNVVLDAQLSEHVLKDERDAALVTELCYGATRRQLALDGAIQAHSSRSLDKLEDKVLAALRLGAYQLFYMRVPRHAAVGETVSALRELRLERATGFVNAVLRKLAALEAIPLPDAAARAAYLAARESHPEWLVRRWLRQFGDERAEQALVADNQAPAVVVRVNSSKISRDALLGQLTEMGVEARPTSVSPVGIVLPPVGRLEGLFGYAEGLWQVQDEAAQLVGLFSQVPSGARVLDACAAPGGKACHLAETVQVTALDIHPRKLEKITAEARRLGVDARLSVVAHDATKPLPKALGTFDAVLVDAPCSGLGTLRRHPELRYRREEKDIGELARLQRAILEQCRKMVRPGGLLVYSVCTPEPQEGADQVELFLRTHPEFTTETPMAKAGAAAVPFPLWQGHLRTLPGPEGWDGFFAARLRRSDDVALDEEAPAESDSPRAVD